MVTMAALALSWAAADDQEIVKALTDQLKQERAAGRLHDFNIDLKVADGQVLLKGHVASPEQQRLAVDIARQTKGVKRVINDLKIDAAPQDAAKQISDAPKATGSTDDEIAQALATTLRQKKTAGSLKGFDIGLSVANGSVTLDGHVSSAEQRRLAETLARGTPGVREVVNEIVVKAPPAAKADSPAAEPQKKAGPTDAQIAQKVISELKRCQDSGRLKGFGIDLLVKDGVATLNGRVASAEQRGLACDIAERTDGVKEVIDRLTVVAPPADRLAEETKPSPTPAGEATPASLTEKDDAADNSQVGRQVVARLEQAKKRGELAGFGIGVQVLDGEVQLQGRVASEDQRQTAIRLAKEVSGVREVVDKLTIEQRASREASPAKIASAVQSRLRAIEDSGRLLGARVAVEVKQETVWMKGTVADEEQHALAIDAVRRVPGVRQVVDALQVNPAVPLVAGLGRVPVSQTGHAVSARGAGGPTGAASTAPSPALLAAADQGVVVPVVAPGATVAGPVLTQPAPAMAVPGVYGPQLVASNYVAASPEAVAVMDQTPRPLGAARMAAYAGAAVVGAPIMAIGQAVGGAPAQLPGPGQAVVPARYDHPNLPGYAWPSYAPYPNYAALTYPKQYSPSAWPYIGPFYPYPQVPLGWRKVTLKWDDGWWNLRFNAK
jgi:osmotically-inducible protein OsmY